MVKKTMPAFPRPFMTLERVALKYIKGQIKLKVIMKCPANGLLNKSTPTGRPLSKKTAMQKMPRSVEYRIVRLTARLICCWFLPQS